ncbi:Ral GTPase-activating protein subunit beta [Fragariocoptes setiger]|uniref:Ral GTPase-activating protein subunit beta n=1 Tax=Fragariocoptes setiger TaxID=1670756 RepID=A0ABQ7S5H7_9ACAR|nr:Ral GTPase-activating protein subunit beta [Fragariocoptes setiger]
MLATSTSSSSTATGSGGDDSMSSQATRSQLSIKSQMFNTNHLSSSQLDYRDYATLNVAETIEQDCLSVLHKLHDQVNGLQLVQVVVQPLAKLFNPTNLATLNLAAPQSSSSPSSSQSAISSSSSTTTSPQATASINKQSSQIISSSSTYMMSPDTAQALIQRLDTDRDVNWLMEIIGYGLSMPFSLTGEQDSVKDCCTIYCEWLTSALLPYQTDNKDARYQQLSKLVPGPIRANPNRYARKMLSHLYNVFLPRHIPSTLAAQGSDQYQAQILTAVARQAVLCHRVLRTIETISQNPSNLMDTDTWDHLLAFLLTINDKLLSSPTESDDIGTQMCDRILGALFDIVLLVCSKSLPSPSFWKTFHQMSLNWRHHASLVDHWRRVTLLLARRLVNSCPKQSTAFDIQAIDKLDESSSKSRAHSSTIVESSSYSTSNNNNSNNQTSLVSPHVDAVINDMSFDVALRVWSRFLHLCGNPVDLANPDIISRTDEFYHNACSSDNVVDPRQHPCLNVLPSAFYKSIRGITNLVETFMGLECSSDRDQILTSRPQAANSSSGSSTAPINSSSHSSGSTVLQTNNSSGSRKSVPNFKAISIGKVGSQKSTSQASNSHTNVSSTTQQTNATTGASTTGRPQQQQQQSTQQHLPPQQSIASLSSDRPKCNSILNVFGDWLFSAALIGSDLNSEIGDPMVDTTTVTPINMHTSNSASEPGSIDLTAPIGSVHSSENYYHSSSTQSSKGDQYMLCGSQKSRATQSRDSTQSIQSHLSQPSSNRPPGFAFRNRLQLDQQLRPESFEAGQAEAIGLLCKIFSSKSNDEDISPVYLARFYLCLQHCLTFGCGTIEQSQASPIKQQLLTSVLINSASLLQHDLDGINILIPLFVRAIELVFENEDFQQLQPQSLNQSRVPQRQAKSNANPVVNFGAHTALRQACISSLLSLLAYPFHFQSLPIRACLDNSEPSLTFASLRPRLIRLLMIAMQTETDPLNIQMLLGGLSLALHDLVAAKRQCDQSIQKKTTVEPSMRAPVNTGESKPELGIARASPKEKNTLIAPESSYNEQQRLSSAFTQLFDANYSMISSDAITSQSVIYESTSGFSVKCLHVVCHLLINVWRHETQVSLAALELLTSLARLSATDPTYCTHTRSSTKSTSHLQTDDNPMSINMSNEYKQATKWICDYISNQCSRPPPAHSRDMHSAIVSAYHCLSVWFYHHPYLLLDSESVDTVMDVIELGISGTKSRQNTTESTNQTIMKEDKQMKPSSMRVREAAEALLNCCASQAGILIDNNNQSVAFKWAGDVNNNIHNDNGCLDELDLVDILEKNGALVRPPNVGGDMIDAFEDDPDIALDPLTLACHRFKYFVDDNNYVLALLDGLGSREDSLVCLIRSPFGRNCWRLRFTSFSSKSKHRFPVTRRLAKRPQSLIAAHSIHRSMYGPNVLMSHHNVRAFPESVDAIALTRLDTLSGLEMGSCGLSTGGHTVPLACESQLRHDNDKMLKVLSQQILAEQNIQRECSIRVRRVECDEPHAGPNDQIEAARLIIAQLGYTSSVVPLDSNDLAMMHSLRALDKIGLKTCDTAYVFYVRKNRTTPVDILESAQRRHNVSRNFYTWLLELGHPVVVEHHWHWTGNEASYHNKCARHRVRSLSVSHRAQVDTQYGAIDKHKLHNIHQEHVSNSSKTDQLCNIDRVKEELLTTDQGGAIFDGERMSLYWSDVSQEFAFLMPSRISSSSSSAPAFGANQNSTGLNADNTSYHSVISSSTVDNSDRKSITSVTSDETSASSQASRRSYATGQPKLSTSSSQSGAGIQDRQRQRITTKKRSSTITNNVGCDTAIIICWLESYDDISSVPTDWLLAIAESSGVYNPPANGDTTGAPELKSRDFVKIFICPLKNGLFTVRLSTSFGRPWLALPLVDGMTVSRQILATMIRSSVVNVCRRRRLDADHYQPPHVKRRLKIQEITNAHKLQTNSKSDLYNLLFEQTHP